MRLETCKLGVCEMHSEVGTPAGQRHRSGRRLAQRKGCSYAWFPAWLMVVKPALAGRLGEARVQRDQAASRAMVLLGEVLRREHEGDQHELIGLRQELRRLHAGPFDAYMATWKVQHR
jgi:hypothetical protein